VADGEKEPGSTTRPGKARIKPPARSVIMIESKPRSSVSVWVGFSASAGNPLTRAVSAMTFAATACALIPGEGPAGWDTAVVSSRRAGLPLVTWTAAVCGVADNGRGDAAAAGWPAALAWVSAARIAACSRKRAMR
jgi:hypothetical protein